MSTENTCAVAEAVSTAARRCSRCRCRSPAPGARRAGPARRASAPSARVATRRTPSPPTGGGLGSVVTNGWSLVHRVKRTVGLGRDRRSPPNGGRKTWYEQCRGTASTAARHADRPHAGLGELLRRAREPAPASPQLSSCSNEPLLAPVDHELLDLASPPVNRRDQAISAASGAPADVSTTEPSSSTHDREHPAEHRLSASAVAPGGVGRRKPASCGAAVAAQRLLGRPQTQCSTGVQRTVRQIGKERRRGRWRVPLGVFRGT